MTKQELKQILNNFKIYYNIRDLFAMNDDEIEKHLLNLLQDHADAYNAFYDTLDKHEQQSISAMLDALDNAIDALQKQNNVITQTYIKQLPKEEQKQIKNKIIQKLKKLGYKGKELQELTEEAMDSKKSDVRDLLKGDH